MTNNSAASDGAALEGPYSVNLWGSDPDAGNDDCWTGADFATLDQAVACYRALVMFPIEGQLSKACGHDWEFVELDGPNLHEVTANPDQVSQRRHRLDRARSDGAWRREIATQAGMSHGCDGYNEAMGW
jgi:hypothetical protein